MANRAERRAISRANQRWLKALWASDAPLPAKQLGAELVAAAQPDGRVALPDENGQTQIYRLSIPPTAGGRTR